MDTLNLNVIILYSPNSHQMEKLLFWLYKDDVIVTGDCEEIRWLKSALAKEFKIKELGELKYFLGMEVAQSKKRIVISKKIYLRLTWRQRNVRV